MTNIDYNAEPSEEELAAASQPARFGEQGRGLATELASDKLRSNLETPVLIGNAQEYEALKPGQKYIDPERNERVKPYNVKNRMDYETVPEGADYFDPEGNARKKPKFEGIGYSAQTLYSMALTDREKKKILEKFYPGQVQGEGDDIHVIDENGVYRKPGRLSDVRGTMGVVAGNIAPIGLGAVGSVTGAAAGTLAAPGAGSFGGGVAGGALGGLAGQTFNDIILQLNGVYDRTPGENALDKSVGVAASAGGDLAARGAAAFVPSMKAGASKATNALPDIANKMLETTPEGVRNFRRIAELGEGEAPGVFGMAGSSTSPGISTFAPGSPRLQMAQEVKHEGFTTSETRKRAAERAYEKSVDPLIEQMAIGKQLSIDDMIGPPTKESVRETAEKFTEELVSPTAATSSRQAGEMLKKRALMDAQELDKNFADELARRQRAAELGLAPQTAQREQIDNIAQERNRVASRLIDGALQDVERNADEAVRAAAQGSNSGDLWAMVGRQLLAVKQGLSATYGRNAREAAATVPNGARVRVDGLVDSADEFINQMPAEFAGRNPALVQRIRALGRRPNPDFDPEAGIGERFLPPQPMRIDELHQLRTELREASDYHDLPSSFRNFATKNFAGQVDQLMHAVGNTPQFRTAMRLIDENDAWYARERPVFNAREMKSVVRALESGEQADPEMLFKALVKPGNADLIARAQQVVGPNLWSGVRGAQRNAWLRKARQGNFDNTVDASKFAKEVLEDFQDGANGGTLYAVQGPQRGQQLMQLAQQIAALDGSLSVTFRPNDPAFEIFRQAHLAMQQAKQAAATDPLAVLQQDLRNIKRQVATERGQARRDDELNFLYRKSVGGAEAVDKILNNEDLILATAHRFGEHSPEFNALRQVWIERVFKGELNPAKELGKATADVQRLMMGVNLDTARKLAQDMEFIMSSRAFKKGDGEGMMVVSKIEHPTTGKPGLGSKATKLIPGLNFATFSGMQKYYSVVDKVLGSPSFARWLERSYSGGAENRKAIREILSKQLQRAGAMGSAGGMGLYEVGGEQLSLPQ